MKFYRLCDRHLILIQISLIICLISNSLAVTIRDSLGGLFELTSFNCLPWKFEELTSSNDIPLIPLTSSIPGYNPCDLSTFSVKSFTSILHERYNITQNSTGQGGEVEDTAWIAYHDYDVTRELCGGIPWHLYYPVHTALAVQKLGGSGYEIL